MLDTMTFTKAVGGLCGALLIFLLGKWAAEELYHVGGYHGKEVAAYVIDTGEDDAAAEEEAPVDFATLLASADVGKGEKVFGKCRACHKIEDGANGTGPHLYGIVGRTIGGVDGFGSYSGALDAVAEVWTAENLNGFLENPRGWAPGTSMSYAGLKKPEDRANLIAWLDTLDD
ncbi:MAG: cytochrome c family protein [Paracoccaceae bacterium]|nr:cytochrome c family protein [Paracoccaceae bacterium]